MNISVVTRTRGVDDVSSDRYRTGTALDRRCKMVKNMVMEAPIAEVKKRLCELVDLVETGETIVILRHGHPVARLVPMPARTTPWRVERPDDRRRYKGINIDEPALEDI